MAFYISGWQEFRCGYKTRFYCEKNSKDDLAEDPDLGFTPTNKKKQRQELDFHKTDSDLELERSLAGLRFLEQLTA